MLTSSFAGLVATIPYTTFPDFEIGPLTIRSFGLLVGIGVIVGAWTAARYVEQFGIPREETYRLATRMVVVGIIGSRVTWVLSHLDQIDNPIDVIAVWEGGIQFSGGFIAALIVGYPTFRNWSPKLRWRSLDGYAYGLTIGLAIGRIGCYSVGEHFGRFSDFFLATEYQGGGVQEDFIGDTLLQEGMSFHNTSLYELLHLTVLFFLMSVLLYRSRTANRELPPGTLVALFTVWYGVARFLTDFVRINDNTVAGLTGAQFMVAVMAPAGLWILFRTRHLAAELPEDPEEIAAIRERSLARTGAAATPSPDAAATEVEPDVDDNQAANQASADDTSVQGDLEAPDANDTTDPGAGNDDVDDLDDPAGGDGRRG